ncbi:hypothetical protein M3N64_00150 [Sporolactobacillus sp. CPB3-1]|uniref:DUF2231 domain-containing protein n=1 Tax=Sporolactobacillus mangiferae TaxID=2940498 RepID=A0ABT0M699_9BACL|nr:DUF2231 domain-containing protein [Sporolactobacillus mangiferae]MCL1630367.1 hypothetical protein [Sporolactobacillus mangiferae]
MFEIPLHPLIVHFPIALLLLGSILQILSLWKRDFFDKTALLLLSLGLLSGIAAFLTGDGAERFAREHWGNAYRSLVETHQFYAAATLLLFSIAIVLRLLYFIVPKKIFAVLIPIFCILGSIMLALTGHYGGQMVYVQKHAELLPLLPQ